MSFYNQKWDKPYLTPSIAVTLLTKTPYHARLACPYYGLREDVSSDAMNEGRIVDCLVLGGDPAVTVLDVDDYRTKEARELRDAAVNPVKRADYDRCLVAAGQAQHRMTGDAYNAIKFGTIKKRLFWKDDGVECSTEPDIVYNSAVLDLKRTKVAPTAANWQRHAASMMYHVQAAACLEATGAKRFGWIVVEADPPHCVVVHWASEMFIAAGERDWNYAKAIWLNCIETDHFPAYESGEIDPTAWLIGDEREETNYAEDSK